MRVIPAPLLAHFKGSRTSIAICWLIEKSNGTLIRGTEHDADVVLPTQSPDDLGISGTYFAKAGISGTDIKSSSDGSVDNMEVSGGFPTDALVVDVTLDDLNSGLLTAAPVTVFACNWQDPTMGYVILLRGYLGQPTHTSDGGYTVEIRSLAQLLTQNVCQSYNENCNVIRFGDARCKFDVSTTLITGSVTGVTSRRIFAVNMAEGSPSPQWSYSGGLLTWLTGNNATFQREVKLEPQAQIDGFLELWDQTPEDIQVGDTYQITAGCDRTAATCQNVFNNLVNFRGYGVYIPGVMALTQGPT
jgi:uncharacterized phage protein (TIGR02218 family)